MFNGLRSVSQMKKLKMEAQHKQEIAALRKRFAEGGPMSPAAASETHSPAPSITAGDSDSSSDAKKTATNKKLRFATVEVRTMNRAPGEGVPRSGSAPLGLGWNVLAEEVKSVNAFEQEKRKRGVGPLPEDRRQQILLKAGIPQADLEREKNQLTEVLRQRLESLGALTLCSS